MMEEVAGSSAVVPPPVECLLCSASHSIKNGANNKTTTTGGGGGGVTTPTTTPVSFKNLLKYLNINLSRLSSLISNSEYLERRGDGGEGSGSGGGGDGVEEAMAELLCEECASLADMFGGIYQDFETARLLLHQCVQLVRVQVMKKGGGGGRVGGEGAEPPPPPPAVDDLKAEILKQCDLKLKSVPRVELPRVTTAPVAPNGSQIPPPGWIPGTPTNGLLESLGVDGNTMMNETGNGSQEDEEEEDDDSEGNDDLPSEDEGGGGEDEEEESQDKSSAGAGTSCLYCEYVGTCPSITQRHTMCKHPAQFFKGQLPPDSTDKDIFGVIKQMCNEGKMVPVPVRVAGKRGGYKCFICNKTFSSLPSPKFHIFKEHLAVVISRLGGFAPPPGSSKGMKTPKGAGAALQTKRSREESATTTSKVSTPPPPFPTTTSRGDLPEADENEQSDDGGDEEEEEEGVVHPRQKAWKCCPYCELMSVNNSRNRLHMMTVHPVLYFAEQFPRGTTDEDVAQVIKQVCLEGLLVPAYPTRGAFWCSFCNKIVKASSQKYHLVVHHVDIIASRLKQNLKGKEEQQQQQPTRVFQCRNCSKKFQSRAYLQQHHKICGSTSGRRNPTKTKKSSPARATIPSSPSPPPPHQKHFKCRHCDKKFLYRKSLQTHLTQHGTSSLTKEGNYPCAYCDYSGRDKTRVETHQLTSHTLQFCEKELPAGTSSQMLEDAVQAVIQANLSMGRNHVHRCRLCSKDIRLHTKRAHVLRLHLKDVVAVLKKTMKGRSGDGGDGGVLTSSTVNGKSRGIIGGGRGRGFVKHSSKLNRRPAVNVNSNSRVPIIRSNKYLECRICRKRFLYQKNYQRHLETHDDDGGGGGGGGRGRKQDEPTTTSEVFNCSHCDFSTSYNSHMKSHMIVTHPLIFYADQLPRRTSEESLNAAITAVIEDQARLTVVKKPAHYHCKLCSKVCRIRTKSDHILKQHLEYVKAALKKSSPRK